MERARIAREVRRRHVVQAIEDERDRERSLAEQLEEAVAAVDGPAVDREVFAALDAGDVALVREALEGLPPPDEEDDGGEAAVFDLGLDEDDGLEEEIERLQSELGRCRARARALERYLAALDAAGGREAPAA